MSQRSNLEQAELLWLLEQCLRFSSPQTQEELSSPETTVQSEHTPLTVDTNEKEIDTLSSRDPEVKRKTPQRTNTAQVSVEGDEPKVNFGSGSQDNLSVQINQTLPPLFDDLEMARTLRQILQSSQTNNQRYLNISETVSTSASIDDLLPVFAPESHSDSTLIIIQERTDSLAPFDELQDSIKRVAETYVHFYRVLIPNLTKESITKAAIDIPNPKHCVVLFISDGLSPLVQRGQLIDYLEPLPSGCKVIWVHPWRVESRPPYVRRMPPERPEELPSKRDREQISVQIVGLQNIQFQRIIHFVNGRSLTWNDGKLLRMPTKRRRREGRKLSSDEALSIELTIEEQELAALQLRSHVEAYSGKETLQLLGVVACLPDGCIDTNMLVQLAQSVFGVQYDQTDLAQLLSAGVLAKHVDLSTDSVLVVGFNDRILRQTSQAILSQSTIRSVIRELCELAKQTEQNHKHFETMGLNINLLLQLSEGTVSTEGRRKEYHSGTLSDYIELADLMGWYEGLSQLQQFERSINAQDSSVLESDQTIQQSPRSPKPESQTDSQGPSKPVSASFWDICDKYAMTGFLFRRLCTLFPKGLPVSVLEHFANQHENLNFATELKSLLGDLLKSQYISKRSQYIIDENDLFFVSADWKAAPPYVEKSHIEEDVWVVSKAEHVNLVDFQFQLDELPNLFFLGPNWNPNDSSDDHIKVLDTLTKWMKQHWQTIPHFEILASRFSIQHYFNTENIFHHTENMFLDIVEQTFGLKMYEQVCLTDIWLIRINFDTQNIIWRAGLLFFDYLQKTGLSNLQLPKINEYYQYTLRELYNKICWMMGLSIFIFEYTEVTKTCRLRQILENSDVRWKNEESRWLEHLLNFNHLYNILDWNAVDENNAFVSLDTTDLDFWDDDDFSANQDTLASLDLFIGSIIVFQKGEIESDIMMSFESIFERNKLFLDKIEHGHVFHTKMLYTQLVRQLKTDTHLLYTGEDKANRLLTKLIDYSLLIGHQDRQELFERDYFIETVREIFSNSNEVVIPYSARIVPSLYTGDDDITRSFHQPIHVQFSPYPLNRLILELQDSQAKDYSSQQWIEWYGNQNLSFVNESNSSVCFACDERTYTDQEDTFCNVCASEVIGSTTLFLKEPWAAFPRTYLPPDPPEISDKRYRAFCLNIARITSQNLINILPSINFDTLEDDTVLNENTARELYEYFNESLALKDFAQTSFPLYSVGLDTFGFGDLCLDLGDLFMKIWKNFEHHFHVKVYSSKINDLAMNIRTSLSTDFMYDWYIESLSSNEQRHLGSLMNLTELHVVDAIQNWHGVRWESDFEISEHFNSICCRFEDYFHKLTGMTSETYDQRATNNKEYLLPFQFHLETYKSELTVADVVVHKTGTNETLLLPNKIEWIDPVAETLTAMIRGEEHPHRTCYPHRAETYSYQVEHHEITSLDAVHSQIIRVITIITQKIDKWLQHDVLDGSRINFPSQLESKSITALLRILICDERIQFEDHDDAQQNSIYCSGLSDLKNRINSERKILYNVDNNANVPTTSLKEVLNIHHRFVNDLWNLFFPKEMENDLLRLSIEDFDLADIPLTTSLAYTLAYTTDTTLLSNLLLSRTTPMRKQIPILLKAHLHSQPFLERFAKSLHPPTLEEQLENMVTVLTLRDSTSLSLLDEALLHVEYLFMILQLRNPDLYNGTKGTQIEKILSFENPDIQTIALKMCHLYTSLEHFAIQIAEHRVESQKLSASIHLKHQEFYTFKQMLMEASKSEADPIGLKIESTQRELKTLFDLVSKRFQDYPFLSGFIDTYAVTTKPKSLSDIKQIVEKVLKVLFGFDEDIIGWDTLGEMIPIIEMINNSFVDPSLSASDYETPYRSTLFPRIQKVVTGILDCKTNEELLAQIIKHYPHIEKKQQHGDFNLFGHVNFNEGNVFNIFYLQVPKELGVAKWLDKSISMSQNNSPVLLWSIIGLLETDSLDGQTLIAVDFSPDGTGVDAFITHFAGIHGSAFYHNLEEIITLKLTSSSEGNHIELQDCFHEKAIILDGYEQKYTSNSDMVSSITKLIEDFSGIKVISTDTAGLHIQNSHLWTFDGYDLNNFTIALSYQEGSETQDVKLKIWERYFTVLEVLSTQSLTSQQKLKLRTIQKLLEEFIELYEDTSEIQTIFDFRIYLESQDFETLRDELRNYWSALLNHHQQEGTLIPSEATALFTKLSKVL